MMTSNLLPPELKSQILSRVPATSLKQWRSTCKRWHALFKDPRFIKNNKNLGKAATQMILKKDQSVYSFSFDFDRITKRFDQFIEITGKLKSLKDSEDVSISEIFHCEGLLLCTTKDNRLVVWNPCTGQTRWVPSTPRPSTKQYICKYSLGYGNDNEYEIFSFAYYQNDQNVFDSNFEIYEFNSDSWRVLDVAIPSWPGLTTRGVSLKGNTYWLDESVEDDTDLANFVLRFDFATERFGRLPLPFESDRYDDVLAVLSVVGEEKLALLRLMTDDSDYGMKMWVTNSMTGDAKDFSWSEFLLVDIHKLKIYTMTVEMSFLVREENKMVMYCDADDDDKDWAKVYVVGEDLYKQVYRETSKGSEFQSPLLVGYVPSLVQIPAKQSNPRGKRKR